MALSSTGNRVAITGNGVTTAIPFPIYFQSASDLVVRLKTISTGAETSQSITTHYTVSGAGDEAGGTVTMVTPPTSAQQVIVYRDVPLTQDLEIGENDALPADALEDRLDKAMMAIQRLDERIDRGITLAEGYTGDWDWKMPATLTAGAALIINGAADGVDLGPTTETIEGAAEAATEAAASATAAAASASSASTSATAAAASATAAAASASSASGAAASATAAATSATAAATSATAASTSATAASTSATAAAASASAASTSATAAAASATAAAASATAAAESATDAEDSYDLAAAKAAEALQSANDAADSAASIDVSNFATDAELTAVSDTVTAALAQLVTYTSGTRAAPNAITAGGGIVLTGESFQKIHWVQGSGGAVNVSANPQITAGTAIGQRLTVIGRSDTNTVTLEDGTGLSLNGTWVGEADRVLSLVWDETNWVETSRS